MKMEVEKLGDFLQNCCRVCLSVENEMVDSTNIVENFNKTIDQLLLECVNLKCEYTHPKKLCEECTTELVMVAKFREKCDMSAVALEQLRKQMIKIDKSSGEGISTTLVNAELNDETFYENVEYSEENVEYVIYDTTADLIEESNNHDKSQDSIRSDDEEDQVTYDSSDLNEIELTPRKRKSAAKTKFSRSFKSAKQNEDVENKTETKSLIKYHCKQCGAGFAQMNNYTRHLQTHTDCEIETEQIVSGDLSTLDVENSVEVSTEDSSKEDDCNGPTKESPTKNKKNLPKNHPCQYCDRAFPSGSLLATHTRIHTGERPFKCSTCPKSFKTQGALDLHSRRHSGVKPYKCTVCNRGFVESSNLKVHMRTHTGEKPHQCVTCGRSFSRVFLLQIHQRTHTGEKPYACETCDKSFAQQGDLAAHKRIHSGERPHRCKICQKGFIKSSGLTQHMRRHLRPGKSNTTTTTESNSIEESEQFEMIDTEQNMPIDKTPKEIVICYNDNSESFDEYLENC